MKAELKLKTKPARGLVPVPPRDLERHIYVVRGHKVMLDSDLARLYHVTTKAFNQAVKRNRDRFPKDFMFQFSAEEAQGLRSQIVTLEADGKGRGQHSKYAPHVFTEHGIAMLASVLRSKRAAQMSILIVRAFIRMREMLAEHQALTERVTRLEANQRRHVSVIRTLADEIDSMRNPPERPARRIGFPTDRALQSFKIGNSAGAGSVSKSK